MLHFQKNQSIDDYQYIWEDAMAAYDDMYRFEAFKGRGSWELSEHIEGWKKRFTVKHLI